jgi:hypothetical protein
MMSKRALLVKLTITITLWTLCFAIPILRAETQSYIDFVISHTDQTFHYTYVIFVSFANSALWPIQYCWFPLIVILIFSIGLWYRLGFPQYEIGDIIPVWSTIAALPVALYYAVILLSSFESPTTITHIDSVAIEGDRFMLSNTVNRNTAPDELFFGTWTLFQCGSESDSCVIVAREGWQAYNLDLGASGAKLQQQGNVLRVVHKKSNTVTELYSLHADSSVEIFPLCSTSTL